MKKVKIGLLPLYVKLYDDNSPSMRPRIEEFTETIKGMFSSRNDVELVAGGICRLENEFAEAIALFEKENVDSIVTLHLAYSPSLESEKALKNTNLPIVILDTTPTFDFTYNQDNDVISYNHGIHGVQDMCNLLIRNGKKFYIEAGHYLESDVIERVVKRVKGIKAATSFKNSAVGSIGGSFAGMGDFVVSKEEFEKIGITIKMMTPDDAKLISSKVDDDEIENLIASDKEKYIVSEDLSDEELRYSARGSLTVRKWIEENNLSAFTANFLTITKDFGIHGMPFAEANRSMERGIGFAGEGDVLTAALVGALMSVSDEASFIEMFCPDWKENMIYLSHMGEMNTALTAVKPKFMAKPMVYSDVDTTWICGTYKEGEATIINLAPCADGKFRIIASKVDMLVPDCDKLRSGSTCGWFKPQNSISTFLEDYSKLGGTHHLSLVYGDMRKMAEAFAESMGFEFYEI